MKITKIATSIAAILSTVILILLCSCQRIPKDPSDMGECGLPAPKEPYELIFVSYGNGTCGVKIKTDPMADEDFTVTIPESSPDGDVVTTVLDSEFVVGQYIPRILTESQFEALIAELVKNNPELEEDDGYGVKRFKRLFSIYENNSPNIPYDYDENICTLDKTYNTSFITREYSTLIKECTLNFNWRESASELENALETAYESDFINLDLNFSDRITEIVIPNTVTSIDSYAFSTLPIKNITIPESVTHIGQRAFSECTNLKKIVIPSNVTDFDRGVFANCNAEEITILGNISKITTEFFYNCRELQKVNLPDSVTEIGPRAFQWCESLTELYLPHNVTTICEDAFKWCTNLESITIPPSVSYIQRNAFRGCTSLKSIALPDSLTKIAVETFKGCTSLSSVTISENVTTIEKSAFEDCSALNKIIIPNSVTNIEEKAFYNAGLVEVQLSNNIERIYEYTFYGKYRIREVIIPPSITVIDKCAFYADNIILDQPEKWTFSGSFDPNRQGFHKPAFVASTNIKYQLRKIQN